MEARVAVLEHIAKTNAAAFDRLDQRMERLEQRLDQRMDQLLDRMDRRFDLVERRFEAVDRRFEASDRRYDTLNAHHRADFLWLIAIQIATIGSLLTAMARGFHWI
jgi:predicted transcriptional regulator